MKISATMSSDLLFLVNTGRIEIENGGAPDRVSAMKSAFISVLTLASRNSARRLHATPNFARALLEINSTAPRRVAIPSIAAEDFLRGKVRITHAAVGRELQYTVVEQFKMSSNDA